MRALLESADELLRARVHPAEPARLREMHWKLVACVALAGIAYGTVMGSFGGLGGGRAWQAVYAATKVPILLLGTFVLCLPSFFVLNTLAGLRSDFGQALQALLSAQAGMTIVLCSMAPLTIVWYLSSANYHAAILFNGLAFAVSSLATQNTLRRLYRPLVERSRKHLLLLWAWLGLYGFVGIQLGWLLRPFVGHPDTAVQFFRENAWGNAYIEVLRHFAGLFPH